MAGGCRFSTDLKIPAKTLRAFTAGGRETSQRACPRVRPIMDGSSWVIGLETVLLSSSVTKWGCTDPTRALKRSIESKAGWLLLVEGRLALRADAES